eukprot:COSAG02_NODE_27905_length_600_cov_1.229541_1_plen_45_part_10
MNIWYEITPCLCKLELGAPAFSDRLGPLAGHQCMARGGRVHPVLG